VEALLHDLRECVEIVKGTAPVDTAAIRAMVQTVLQGPDPAGAFRQLAAQVGLTGPALPSEMALINEVLDALPSHRVVARDGRLREILVDAEAGRFVDVEAEPTTPALAARLEAEGVELVEGQRAGVCLAIDRGPR
jgi:hypothetical protein